MELNYFSLSLRTSLFLLLSVSLAACSGGGGSGDDSAIFGAPASPGPIAQDFSAQGIYLGNSTGSSGSVPLAAVVGADGTMEAVSLYDGSVYSGVLSEVGPYESEGNVRGMAAPGTYWVMNGQNIFDGKITARQSPVDGSLTGVLYYQSIAFDNFALDSYQTDYNNPPPGFSGVAGTYKSYRTGVAVSITIDSNGLLSGFDNTGCHISSQLQQAIPNKNLYNMTINLTACGNATGAYTGKGFFILSAVAAPQLAIIGHDNERGAGWLFTQESRLPKPPPPTPAPPAPAPEPIPPAPTPEPEPEPTPPAPAPEPEPEPTPPAPAPEPEPEPTPPAPEPEPEPEPTPPVPEPEPPFGDEDEDGNTGFDSAVTIEDQSVSNGTVSSTGDADFFVFTASESGSYSMALSFSRPNMSLYWYNDDANETLVGESAVAGLTSQVIANQYLEAGKVYYVGIQAGAQTEPQSYKLTLVKD